MVAGQTMVAAEPLLQRGWRAGSTRNDAGTVFASTGRHPP